MKKRLAVLFKLVFIIAFFSLVIVSADSPRDTRQFINTGPVENIDYCNYCQNNYYSSYSKPCRYYYQEYKDKYYYKKDYIDKYYCKPKFTDYKVRSYGHGLQLVRFRLDVYYKDHPNYKTSYEKEYANCRKTSYRTVCYN